MSVATQPGSPIPTAPESAPPKPPRIDWKLAAKLLVGGRQPDEAAAAIGIDEERLWRQLRRSLRLRHYIRQELQRRRLMRQLHVAAGTEREAAQMPQWLAEASGLAGEAVSRSKDEAKGQEEGRDVAEQLGETAARPPNQAFRRRLEAERKEINAQITANRRAVEAAYLRHVQDKLAASERVLGKALARLEKLKQEKARLEAAAAAPKPAEAKSDSNRPESDSNRTERDSNRPEFDSNRTELDTNRTETRSDRLKSEASRPRSSGHPLAYTPPLHQEGKPPPSRARLYRSIIDLPGPDNPMGEEAFSGGPYAPSPE